LPRGAAIVRQIETDEFLRSARTDIAAVSGRLIDVDRRLQAAELRVKTNARDLLIGRVPDDAEGGFEFAVLEVSKVIGVGQK